MNDFLKAWKRHFVFAALLSCFINVLQLTFPFYMFTIYRNVVISRSMFSLSTSTVIALYALVMLIFFNYLRSRLLTYAGRDLNNRLRDEVFTGMLQGYAGIRKQGYRQGLNDIDTLRNYFSNNGMYALFDAPWVPLYLMLVYYFHPLLGIIATGGALVMVLLSVMQEFLIRDKMRQANQDNMRNQKFVEACLRNSELVKGMGMIGNVSDRFEAENQKVVLNQTISSRYAGLVQAIIKPTQNVMQIFIYGSGAYLALTQGFSVGLMVAAAIIMGRALAPLMQAMSSWKFTLQARESYRRLQGFMLAMQSRPDQMPLPDPSGKICARNVTLGIGGSILLNKVSFELSAGDFLGIIGPSGAGKTTLCRIASGIWPAMAGKVELDGVDIHYWDQEKIGSFIGYLPQEVELFPATVAQNIARMGPVDTKKVHEAALLSGVHELINKLPQGYDTLLEGDFGIRLSGGQKQRIGLARALYGEPRLLFLDEPNSNLDEQGEQALLNALQYLKKGNECTCIMVTHKPQLLNSMHKILMLRDGQVAMFGSREDVFARLFRNQDHGGNNSPAASGKAQHLSSPGKRNDFVPEV